jgi:hypothetical protein
MDEMAGALALLQLLPDPNQDLSIQTLSEFTLFPKLPLELRQKIWRHTFPKGRHYSSDVWFLRAPEHPISSQVSRESRDETLRHYHVLKLPKSPSYPKLIHKCFFWNVKRDGIICSFANFIRLFVGSELIEADFQWEHFTDHVASLKILCFQNLSDYSYDLDSFERELLKYQGLTELQVIDCRGENGWEEYGEITEDYLWLFKNLFIKRATSALDGRKYPMPKLIVSRL